MNDYSRFIFLSRYARWNDKEQRRETWEEAVTRFCDFFKEKFPNLFPYDLIWNAIHNMDVMPSMRALYTTGKALERDNAAGYNCSYLVIDHLRAFDECMYLLMCGTGVGFSAERQYINQLPEIPDQLYKTETTIHVSDSRIGWASAFRELLALLYSGKIPKWDLSDLRPAGARLKTFGGRSAGPAPLERLFNITCDIFNRAAGRKLTSLECHDLVCHVADIVIVGGVRRSALISLSNLSDERMRGAKNGQWWQDQPQRALANNSVAYTETPDLNIFMKEWINLYESGAGERGIFNRMAARKQAEATGRRDYDGYEFGTNPCGEIILRSMGFCNLSEIVIRPDDSIETLKEKSRIASIIGTFQSTLTDFRYLRKGWKKNAEEERLLGVSLTGIMDHWLFSGSMVMGDDDELEQILLNLKEEVINTNIEWANKLNINPSVSTTCIKPSGTVSQLVNSSSGIHPAFASYYIRSIRQNNTDPITAFLKDQGIPNEPEINHPHEQTVFYFPQKSASSDSICIKDTSALEQLEHYLTYKTYWCEHNPSTTIYYKDKEFLEVGAWVYNHFDHLGGLSFLPQSNHIYKQAPYVEITEEEYKKIIENFPKISWEKLSEYEKEDNTSAGYELACTSGNCEI